MVKNVLCIGFILILAMGIDSFRRCYRRHTIFEMTSLLMVCKGLFGLLVLYLSPYQFKETDMPYGVAVFGFSWFVILSNMVMAHHVRTEMSK